MLPDPEDTAEETATNFKSKNKLRKRILEAKQYDTAEQIQSQEIESQSSVILAQSSMPRFEKHKTPNNSVPRIFSSNFERV